MAAPPLPALSGRDRVLLALAVGLRLGTGALRFAAEPARFRNFEESYNATVAWMSAHGGLAAEALTLQYRAFCGGCSVVALAGVVPMAASERLWAWKLVPLGWTAAIQLLGFFAVDAWIGRAAAWAFVGLYALPSLGGLDLSLMAWGNHQESGLFLVAALLLVARGRVGFAGVLLGVGIWFARTAAYQAVVLLPLAVVHAGPGRRWRPIVGFAAGLLLLLLPAAGGDAGWYRMSEAIGGGAPATLARRAATLLAPGPLAERLWLPLRDMAPAGFVVLAVALACAWVAGRDRRGRVILALPLAYAAAFVGTKFPIFLLNARAPVNNLRYHAPWVLTLTLLVAAGVGLLWSSGRRRGALALLAPWLFVHAVGLGRADWSPDAEAARLSALDLPYFVSTAAPRLDADALAAPVSDPRAAATRARLYGLVLGRGAATGGLPDADSAARVRGMAAAVEGFGEARVSPCETLEAAEYALGAVAAEDRPTARRGAALTLSFCETGGPLEARVAALAAAPEGAGYASLLGRTMLERCGGPRAQDVSVLATCVADLAAATPFGEEALYGVGRAWAEPQRTRDELDGFARALGPRAAPFAAGAADPAAGTQAPPFAREQARPPAPTPR